MVLRAESHQQGIVTVNTRFMLEFSKLILDKMSFNENLFMKELRKIIIWSDASETDKLRDWCNENYESIYGEKINEAFNSQM
jgi:hypothetical protein